jgi:transcriptional regulator with XRE-family HTH domain
MPEVQVSKLRLRDVRVQLRLTQLRLATLSKVSEPTVNRAESGLPIRALSAQAILDALNAERIDRGIGPLGLADLDWNIE